MKEYKREALCMAGQVDEQQLKSIEQIASLSLLRAPSSLVFIKNQSLDNILYGLLKNEVSMEDFSLLLWTELRIGSRHMELVTISALDMQQSTEAILTDIESWAFIRSISHFSFSSTSSKLKRILSDHDATAPQPQPLSISLLNNLGGLLFPNAGQKLALDVSSFNSKCQGARALDRFIASSSFLQTVIEASLLPLPSMICTRSDILTLLEAMVNLLAPSPHDPPSCSWMPPPTLLSCLDEALVEALGLNEAPPLSYVAKAMRLRVLMGPSTDTASSVKLIDLVNQLVLSQAGRIESFGLGNNIELLTASSDFDALASLLEISMSPSWGGLDSELLNNKILLSIAMCGDNEWKRPQFLKETYPRILRLLVGNFDQHPEALLADKYTSHLCVLIEASDCQNMDVSDLTETISSLLDHAPQLATRDLTAVIDVHASRILAAGVRGGFIRPFPCEALLSLLVRSDRTISGSFPRLMATLAWAFAHESNPLESCITRIYQLWSKLTPDLQDCLDLGRRMGYELSDDLQWRASVESRLSVEADAWTMISFED